MADATEILKVFAPVVSILIAAIAILRALDRARRELAVSLIYNFANQTNWATARALTIAKELDENVINEIGKKGNASIPAAHYDGIVSILRTAFPEKDLPALPGNSNEAKLNNKEGAFQINPEQSAFILFLWLQWLNRLEGTLAGWQQGAAARDLMAREFEPYVKGTSAELAKLSKIRDGLPIIETFCQQYQVARGIGLRATLGLFR
jgi:hypothetical protein